MSFQASSSVVAVEKIVEIGQMTQFERHISMCCKEPEWSLRKFLKKVLTRAGFEIFEDGYRSNRCDKENRYETVHNMLAIRGENPRVCLVAHTDVCRDHEDLRGESKFSQSQYMAMCGIDVDDDEEKQVVKKGQRPVRKVDPVVKLVMEDGKERRIIQDRECSIQVGGDDRLGVAIGTWVALNSGFDMAILFPTDEEIGLKSSRANNMERLKEFDLLFQIDRGNHSDELVVKISNQLLCTYETGVRLLDIAFRLGMPRSPVNGASTDIATLRERNICKEAINLTCGYHSSFGASAQEYIDVAEAHRTMRFTAEVVKDYYLND